MCQDHRITVEQRCYAAQALWVAVNRMLDDCDILAREWEHFIGYNQMRYKCRCKATTETFFEAWNETWQRIWPVPEEFADVFLRVCVTRKSMNVNPEWKKYLDKELEHYEG